MTDRMTARCPACAGTGIGRAPTSLRLHTPDTNVRCGACDGTGAVNAQRVCRRCGKFRSVCGCLTVLDARMFGIELTKE